MKEVECVISNSSSGIVETPYLGVPTVNIGDRQKGRYLCQNIFSCERSLTSIKDAIENANGHGKYESNNYFGDGHASEKIVETITKFLNNYSV